MNYVGPLEPTGKEKGCGLFENTLLERLRYSMSG
jgi:hypothetical protein